MRESDKNRYLVNMTWPQVEALDRESSVVLLPVGATEQHGPHLPLGTDTLVALDLVEQVADCPQVVVAPPLWCGMSAHHMGFPGSITVRPEVLVDYVYDVIGSLHQHGFAKFLVVNGHRIANLPWLQLVGERVHRQLSGVKLEIFDPAYMTKKLAGEFGFGPVGHADEWETSHLMSAYPQLVCPPLVDGPYDGHEWYQVDPAFGGDTLCYVPSGAHSGGSGVKGCATRSHAGAGRAYRKHLSAGLRRVIALMAGAPDQEIYEECEYKHTEPNERQPNHGEDDKKG